MDRVLKLVTIMQREAKLGHLKLAMARFLPEFVDVAAELQRVLTSRLGLEQMCTLCFNMGVNYGYLDDSDKQTLAHELVEWMIRRDRLSDLIDAVLFPDQVGHQNYEAVVRRRLVEKMDLTELRWLSFDLGVEWDSLIGDDLDVKSRELMSFMKRRGRLSEFVNHILKSRPEVLPEDGVWAHVRREDPKEALHMLRKIFRETPLDPEVDQELLHQMQIDKLTSPALLCETLEQHISDDDLRMLCLELQIDVELLTGEELTNRQHELVEYLERYNRLEELALYLVQTYPQIVDGIKEA